ncbi:hypothetical protein [Aliarcobacter skirrowii]|uniref:hypothetical protein n=1 Tax=Aliarcobacter skirrowii TaxID=28200 RepID=UPI002A36B1B4|nr:hypothetical protein [Aliarcobacter skirrowii]MDY0181563.1 hypothetical protein [Aliarcobacter skirrowii]
MKNDKKWFLKFIILSFILVVFVVIFNYIVDPYGIYKTNFFPNKLRNDQIIRLVKTINVENIKPVSISLGNSRVEAAFNPDHEYFAKPSYNLAVSGETLYESRLFLEHAIKQGNLKQVLIVADWIMFNNVMKKVPDFESYFEVNRYKYLFSFDMFKNSIKTIKNKKNTIGYLKNGLLYTNSNVIPSEGHLITTIKDEKYSYQHTGKNNIYMDTKIDSLNDFRKILELCHENNIKLDIIFSPLHIRRLEVLDYYQNIENWYDWKKKVVLSVEEVAKKYNQNTFKVVDFAIYHEITSEEFPKDPKKLMKYYVESSHYKKELGDIVLDRLLDISPYKDFGIELNSQNIDSHIQKLREDRVKFIDIEAYIKEVFKK